MTRSIVAVSLLLLVIVLLVGLGYVRSVLEARRAQESVREFETFRRNLR